MRFACQRVVCCLAFVLFVGMGSLYGQTPQVVEHLPNPPKPMPQGPGELDATHAPTVSTAGVSPGTVGNQSPCPAADCQTECPGAPCQPCPCRPRILGHRINCARQPQVTVVVPQPEVIIRQAPCAEQPCREYISHGKAPCASVQTTPALSSAPAATQMLVPQISYSIQPVVSMQAVPVLSVGLATAASQNFATGLGVNASAFGIPGTGLSGFAGTGLGLGLGQAQGASTGLSEADLRLLRALVARAAAQGQADSQGSASAQSAGTGATSQDLEARRRELASDLASVNKKLDQEIQDVQSKLLKMGGQIKTNADDIKALQERINKLKDKNKLKEE